MSSISCYQWRTAAVLVGCSPGSQPAQNCEGSPVVVLLACHKPFEHLDRLAVDHNYKTTRSTYAGTSTAWDTIKNWFISFLVTKSFSLIWNKSHFRLSVIKLIYWLTWTLYGKKSSQRTDTKILRIIYFAYDVGIIRSAKCMKYK